MDNSREDIEKYLNGELGALEKKAIEEKITEDESFALQVEEQRQRREGGRLHAWKKTLLKVDQELESKGFFDTENAKKNKSNPNTEENRRSRIRRLWNSIAIAASILVLLVIGAGW